MKVELPLLGIILPIGISFYTLHTISYIVDSYRGYQADARTLEFATYVSFFSQLVAGPIVRFRQIEEDLENLDGTADRTRWLDRGYVVLRHRDRRRRCSSPTRWPRSSIRSAQGLPALVRRGLAGLRATPTSSTSISLATATWRSGWGSFSGSESPELQLALQAPTTSPISGGAGTSRSRRCLRDYLYIPSAATAAASAGPTAT